MDVSSRSGADGRCWGEGAIVTQQRPQHVDQASDQREQRLSVDSVLATFALVKGSRRTIGFKLSTRSWGDTKLLAHLVGKLEPKNVYINVVAHTVWALLQHRPAIVHDEPGTLGRLQERAARVLDEAAVSVQSRRELEVVFYGLRIADGR